MIITIGSTKGGVGKSTVACNLAVCAARDKKKVLLVDADIQASSTLFVAAREKNDIETVQITSQTLYKDLSVYDHDYIFVDAGGRDTKVFRSAILASDVLIIPCQPSALDFWVVSDVVDVLNEARFSKDIQAYFLLNQVIPNTKLAKEIIEAVREFKKDAKLLKNILCSRIAYKNAFAEGKGVIELNDKKAKEEMIKLYRSIKKIKG